MDTTPSYPVDRLSKRRPKGVRTSASPRKSNKTSASIDSSDAGVASAILRYALSTNSPLSNSALPSSNTSTTNTTISFTDMPAPPAGEFHLHGLAPTAPTPSTQPHNSSEGSIPGLQLGKENTPSNNASSDQGSSSHKGSGVTTSRPKVLVPNTITPVPGRRILPPSSPLKMTTRAIRGASALRAKANQPTIPLASPALSEAGPSSSPSRRSARIQKRGSDEATADSGSATQRSSYSNPDQSQDSVVGLGYADARPLSLSSGQRKSPTQSFGNVLVKATPTSSWESSQTPSDPAVSQPAPPQLPRPVSPTPEQPPVSLSLPFSLPSSDDNPDGVEDDDSIFRPSNPATRLPQRPFVPLMRRHLATSSGIPNTFTTSTSSAFSTPLEIGSATQIDEQLQQVSSKESSLSWLGAPTQLAADADASMLEWSHDPSFEPTQPNNPPMAPTHHQAFAERDVAAVVALLTAPITPAAAHAWVDEATQPAIDSPQPLRRRLPTLVPPSSSGSQPIPGLQAPVPPPQSPPAPHRTEPVPASRRTSDPRKTIRSLSPPEEVDDAPSVHLLKLAEVAAMRTPVRPGPNTPAAQSSILVPETTYPTYARMPSQEQRANSDDAHPPHPQTLHTPKRLAKQKQLARDVTPTRTVGDMDTDEYCPSNSPTTRKTGQKRKRTDTLISARATRSTPASTDLPSAKRRKPNESSSRKPPSKITASAKPSVRTELIGTRVLIQWTDKAWYPGYVSGPILRRGTRVTYPVCFDDDVLDTPPVPLAKLRKLHLKNGDRVNIVKIIDQDRDIVGDAEVSDASRWNGGAGEVEVDFGVEGEKVMVQGFHFKVDARTVKEGWDDRKLTEDQVFGPGEEGGDSVLHPTPPYGPLQRVMSRSAAAPLPPSRKASSISHTRSTTTSSRPLSSTRSFSTLPPSTAFRRKGFLITNEKGSMTSSRIIAAGGTVFQSWSQVFEWHASVTMSGGGVGSWVAGLSDIMLEPGVLNGEGECGGDGVDSVFLIADCPVMTSKYLLALALGVPCVSNVWVAHCWQEDEEQANDWSPYLLSAGRAEHLNAECSQWIDQTWGSDPSQLQNLMSNPIVKRIFKGKTFLCIGYQPHKMLPPEENPYPFILSAMGAAAVHVVADRSAARLNTHFDYILSKEEAANTSTSISNGGGVAGGHNGVSASVAGSTRAAAGGRVTRGGGGRDGGPRGTTSLRKGAGTGGEAPEAIDERWIKQCLITRAIAPAP